MPINRSIGILLSTFIFILAHTVINQELNDEKFICKCNMPKKLKLTYVKHISTDIS